MERLITKKLDEWRHRTDRKVLLFRGARQSGKTYCINSFAKKFDQYLYYDLSNQKDRQIFENKSSFGDLLQAIFFMKDKKRRGNRSLIFLDEVADSPSALQWLPHFYKKAKDLYVITSSSMDLNSVFPGDKNTKAFLEPLVLHPYSFYEFLGALGEDSARESYDEIPFPIHASDKLIRFFNLYTLIGGMPEIVENYARDRELSNLQPIYEKIMTFFIDEIRKCSSSKKSQKLIPEILMNSFPYASMRIKFNFFGNSASRSRESAQSFRTLENLLLLQLIYPSVSTILPIQGNLNKSPRLQLLDSGLINYFSGIQKQVFESDDLLSIFDGQIARHVVGQEILSSSKEANPELHFWVRDKPQSTAEVDFLISYEGMVIPVVLKPGEPGRLRSLHQFMDAATHPYAVRLWAHHLSIQQTQTIRGKKFFLMSLPYFLAGKISEHLAGFIKLVNN
jgi:uncharacterized protein